MPTATKRQFVMLSHTLEEVEKGNVAGWFMSDKLDGLRMIYDGGISRGLPVREVPFANWQKDDRYVNRNYEATGLWSRNAKVIRAPDWFLDLLPPIPLDGEIWGGVQNWEATSSIVKKIEPDERDWAKVQFHVFECPPFDVWFQPGLLETELYTHHFDDNDMAWVKDRANKLGVTTGPGSCQFEYMLQWINNQNIENDHVRLLPQTQLPYSTSEAVAIINQRMEEVVAARGEGVMLRNPMSCWTPERTRNLLKVKKWYDSEATVKWYIWGKRTSKGSKLLGKMGTMAVEWNGKVFEIAGFNDRERELVFEKTGETAYNIGVICQGQKVQDGIINPIFPIGSKVTFRFRDLSAIGMPKSGQYMRKAINL